jgi:hypothetical protein
MGTGTIMHELGHNLGLHHGGNEGQNFKPNYNSVMSYQYQFYGVDNNCTIPGGGELDYSHGTRPSLDENDLDESVGICGGVQGTDWNFDGDVEDTNLATNIDGRWTDVQWQDDCSADGVWCVVPTRFDNSSLTVLTDHNDWANLVFTGILDSNELNIMAENIMREVIVEAEIDIREFMTPAGEHSDPIDPLAPTQIPTRRPGG